MDSESKWVRLAATIHDDEGEYDGVKDGDDENDDDDDDDNDDDNELS